MIHKQAVKLTKNNVSIINMIKNEQTDQLPIYENSYFSENNFLFLAWAAWCLQRHSLRISVISSYVPLLQIHWLIAEKKTKAENAAQYLLS